MMCFAKRKDVEIFHFQKLILFQLTIVLVSGQQEQNFTDRYKAPTPPPTPPTSPTPPTPPAIYLGLYNSDGAEQLRAFERDNYQCGCTEFHSLLNGTERSEECKYYGDCCRDPMRVRERLEPGTFSCQPAVDFDVRQTHSYIYIIDKCPADTADEELSSLCQRSSGNDALSIYAWPVTASHSGVTYRNIYCAICNGVLDVPQHRDFDDGVATVKFWWFSLNCDNDTATTIDRENIKFSAAFVRSHISSRRCSRVFASPLGIPPHQCLPAVRTCPEGYTDEELVSMCEMAPVDYRSGTDGRLYRNRFCQLCHGLESLLAEMSDGLPCHGLDNSLGEDELLHTHSLSSPQNFSTTTHTVVGVQTRLVSLRPQVQATATLDLSLNDLKKNISILRNIFLSQVNNPRYAYTYNLTSTLPTQARYWDLGSILCDSDYDGVCDQLIKLPEGGCFGPGCGADKWQDVSGQCYSQLDYKYNPQVRKNMSFTWPLSFYGRYYSTCNENVTISSERNCRCDPRCHFFGDCCFDALKPAANMQTRLLNHTCVPFFEMDAVLGFALINSCPEDADAELKVQCAKSDLESWSPYGWPVTNPVTSLSYSNIYCAMCHRVNVSSAEFWKAILDCNSTKESTGKTCNPRTFAPLNNDTYYWCFQNLVSVCPSYFRDWKISEDCRSGVTSWVYYNKTVYKNAHCAICNLGDEVIHASIEGVRKYAKIGAQFSRHIESRESGTNRNDLQNIELDINSGVCCYNSLCATNTKHSHWGGIHVGDHCRNLPFNTSCGDSNVMFTHSPELLYEFLCSPDFKPEDAPTIPPSVGSDTKPAIHSSPIYTQPTYGEYFFRDVGEPSGDVIHNTSWEDMGEQSVIICADGSLKNEHNNQHYRMFRLTMSGIQARDLLEPSWKPGLQHYDYVILSLSLLFIVCYIFWMLVKNKTKLADLMHISLLVSLFGSLLCYSLSTIPAGRDVVGCQALAAMYQFLFLSTLFWTNSLAISISRAIITLTASSRSRKPYVLYAGYAFGLPLVFTLITFVLSTEEDNIVTFESSVYRSQYICFLGETIVIYALFLAPIYILIIINVSICIAVIVRVTRSPPVRSNNSRDRGKRKVITCIKLSVCLGLGWVLLFVAMALPVIWPVMQIFVEGQGVIVVSVDMFRWKCITGVKSRSSRFTISTQSSTLKSRSSLQSSELKDISTVQRS